MKIDKVYRNVLIVGGVLIVGLVVIFGVVMPLVDYLAKPAYLDILVTPSDVKVEIDGQEYQNAVYGFEPGVYTATLSKDGVEPKILELGLEKAQTTGLYYELRDNGEWKGYTAEELAQKNSVGEVMPIEFAICGTPAKRTNCDAIKVQYDRAPECGNERCMIISGRKSALGAETLNKVREEMETRGYDLDDYQYTYVLRED